MLHNDALQGHVPDSGGVQLREDSTHLRVHDNVAAHGTLEGPGEPLVGNARGLQRGGHRGGEHVAGSYPVHRLQIHLGDQLGVRRYLVRRAGDEVYEAFVFHSIPFFPKRQPRPSFEVGAKVRPPSAN